MLEGKLCFHPKDWAGVAFTGFAFFMVKSRCIPAECSNPGVSLIRQVSLPSANRMVNLET